MGENSLLAQMPEEYREKLKTGASKPFDFEAYEAMRVQWQNRIPGKLEGTDCPLCKNRGYSVELRDGVPVCVECVCMAKRRSLSRMRRSGLGNLLERYTFETYLTPEPWQKTAKQTALDYLRDNQGKWFVAAGSVGAGKTHLCTAICRELMNAGLEVRYMLWKDESRRLKAEINSGEEYERRIRPLKTVRVLYIDDFWKAGNSGVSKADIDLAFEILNSRYGNERLITLISTELSINQILNMDEAVGSRIYERSRGVCMELTGKRNWRLRSGES